MMKNNECLSDTCPVCGSLMASQVTYTPVRGRIQANRKYSCGRRVRLFFEVTDAVIEADCEASGKRTGKVRLWRKT